MKILKIDKDMVQVELTREEIETIRVDLRWGDNNLPKELEALKEMMDRGVRLYSATPGGTSKFPKGIN